MRDAEKPRGKFRLDYRRRKQSSVVSKCSLWFMTLIFQLPRWKVFHKTIPMLHTKLIYSYWNAASELVMKWWPVLTHWTFVQRQRVKEVGAISKFVSFLKNTPEIIVIKRILCGWLSFMLQNDSSLSAVHLVVARTGNWSVPSDKEKCAHPLRENNISSASSALPPTSAAPGLFHQLLFISKWDLEQR